MSSSKIRFLQVEKVESTLIRGFREERYKSTQLGTSDFNHSIGGWPELPLPPEGC